ncbi:hypothetical protein [uncultured Maribacter sp.]|uniref:hypothetical protein n=1 Tax=uncultured Maribacter sp. TaxID=431308 RepID=UPI002621DA3B|nr:hypothetical protein [uncultured Maribacter sp.]
MKNRLVPLNEYLPDFLKIIINKDSFQHFANDDEDIIINQQKFMPLICYEVFYTFFVNQHIRNSPVIYLISSEKFLNDSYYGRLQYDNICKLRAIEQRTPIIKASNYGKSLYIDSKGKIENESEEKINFFKVYIPDVKETIYNKTGNWISFLVILALLLINVIFECFSKKIMK